MDRAAVIEIGSTQSDAKRPGVSRLRESSVWAGLQTRIANSDLDGFLPRHATHKSAQRHQGYRQARRDIIRHVIQPGRGASEIKVTFVLVPEHRVQRVDPFIRDRSRYSSDGQVEHGRHEAVGSVFGDRFNDRPHNFRLVQSPGITSHNHRERRSRFRELGLLELADHCMRCLIQTSYRECRVRKPNRRNVRRQRKDHA